MWDTVQTNETHLSHDLPCPRCGHALHTYLACSDTCGCVPPGPIGVRVEEPALVDQPWYDVEPIAA